MEKQAAEEMAKSGGNVISNAAPKRKHVKIPFSHLDAPAGRKVRQSEHPRLTGCGPIAADVVEAGATATDLIVSMLPSDLLAEHVFSMLPKYDRFLAPVCRSFRDACAVRCGRKTETYVYGMTSVKQMEVYLEERDCMNDNVKLWDYGIHDSSEKARAFIAAGTGQRDLVEWAGVVDEHSCNGAARSGCLLTLKWLREGGCTWHEDTCRLAARGGHMEVLKWARANGCPWDEDACAAAAESGQLEVLRWARVNGCPWDGQTCAAAAIGGTLEVLRWARANECPWDKYTCLAAATCGQLEVLRWARANGCPWNRGQCERASSHRQHVLAWIKENGHGDSEEDGESSDSEDYNISDTSDEEGFGTDSE